SKSGTIDFKTWYRQAHGERTPWGDEESEAFVAAAESALEREISRELMSGKMIPERRMLNPDDTLVEQGEEVAEIGPGAIVGEKALLEGGTRTATLSARTRSRIAVIPGDLIDKQELEELSASRQA